MMIRPFSVALFVLVATSALAAEEPFQRSLEGLTLHGTLMLPDAAPPSAAVLIIAGSGPTDRDGNSAMIPGQNNSLKLLAGALADAGIASLRYDKRMVGASRAPSLTEADLRFDHYAGDAAALLDALATAVPDVPLFLAGHSEGGHLALIASPASPLAGVIVLAGPGNHPADVIDQQLRAQLPPALLEEARTTLDTLRAGETDPEPPSALASLFRPSVQPYLISWFAHDPALDAAVLDLPLLLVYGSSDLQVPPSEGERLKTAVPSAKLVVIEGMNHVLKSVGDDLSLNQSSYGDPELALAPDLTSALIEFVRSVSR